MEEKLLKAVRRQYYLAEALAIYDAYYRPLVCTFPPAKHREQDASRRDDRPLTWVPIVFHCTTHRKFYDIVKSGRIKPGDRGFVSFTEIPIGELDRMKIRHKDSPQVAIAFPRRYAESLSVAPVLYAKHHAGLRKGLERIASEDLSLKPFVELDDDVSAFQELRTTMEVNIQDAVWLLTTELGKQKTPFIQGLELFKGNYGAIPTSYWHRSHQLGMLGEMRYLTIQKNQKGELTELKCVGEYYADRIPFKFAVTLPKGETEIYLRSIKKDGSDTYSGSVMYDIDVAYSILQLIRSYNLDCDEVLTYRQIKSYPDRFGT